MIEVTFSQARAFIDALSLSPFMHAHLAAVFGIDGIASNDDARLSNDPTAQIDPKRREAVANLADYLRAVADAIDPARISEDTLLIERIERCVTPEQFTQFAGIVNNEAMALLVERLVKAAEKRAATENAP